MLTRLWMFSPANIPVQCSNITWRGLFKHSLTQSLIRSMIDILCRFGWTNVHWLVTLAGNSRSILCYWLGVFGQRCSVRTINKNCLSIFNGDAKLYCLSLPLSLSWFVAFWFWGRSAHLFDWFIRRGWIVNYSTLAYCLFIVVLYRSPVLYGTVLSRSFNLSAFSRFVLSGTMFLTTHCVIGSASLNWIELSY